MSTTTQPLRFGLLLPTREMAMTGEYAVGPLLELAREAEAAGFDSVWTGDSLTARPRLDPLIVLAAVAGATSRISVGTGALTAALRHPLVGANMVASLHHAAGSRLELGVGAGFPMPESEAEFDAVGVPFAGRAGRLDETVRLWKQAWGSGGDPAAGSFRGKHLSADLLHRLPPAATAAGPRVWLAGSDTPRVLERVATGYDGWLPFLPTTEAYDRAWRRIGELLAEHGRPADAVVPGLYATLNVDPDRARAAAGLDEYVRGYYGRPLDVMTGIQAYGYGSAEECAEWLTGYVRAGARHVVLRIGSLDAARQFKELAEHVLPAVRASVG
ncbi:LLM class flavin-dependent oxidoreductase [Kitasatospora sp. NBC_00070]|uniref:LLM class flavin-dependent oxidoreductase n=1 Tax=Kitasatospora sp. NBC_00070 TaxID=2975962 RepID=UPI00324541C6